MTEKIIPIRCKGNRCLRHDEFSEFQGNLKKLSKTESARLRSSLLRHGWIAPVFVWAGNKILDGHGRLLVLKELLKDGYEIGPIPVADIEADTETQAAEILLTINSKYQTITEQGLEEFVGRYAVDLELLREQITLPDINMAQFITSFEGLGGAEDGDNIPPVPEEPVSRPGDLYILGRHRLMCGSSTRRDDLEQLTMGRKADMLFADPPYGVCYADKNRFLNAIAPGNRIQRPIEKDHQAPEDMSKFWRDAFTTVGRFMTPGAAYYITGPQGGDLLLLLLLLLALREAGYPLHHMLIWAKNNHVLGRADYNYKHEPIIYGWMKGSHKFYGPASETSLWEIDKPLASTLHPTMKPVALVTRAIRNSTKGGQTVLDPFMGSGTTMVACEETGRVAYGMEIDPYYVDVIVTRYCRAKGTNRVTRNSEEIEWVQPEV